MDFNTKKDHGFSEKELKDLLKTNRKKISKIQEKLYSQGKYSVLICLQGMDTAGKDSLIRELSKEINPTGLKVVSFKTPSKIELSHDYLWRHYLALPKKGEITIFNRTHYENVLVTRVHPEYILNENIPNINCVNDIDDDFWNARFEQINNFEKHLVQNGTIVLKFFLNISKQEQKNRLLRRINIANKNWKFSPSDLKERGFWDKYQNCYRELLQNTSTDLAPWNVIPSDEKPYSRYLVSEIILKTLEQYDIEFPVVSKEVKDNLNNYKTQLS